MNFVDDIILNPIAFSFSVMIIISAFFGYFKPSRRLQSIKKRLEEAIKLLPKKDHRNEFAKNYQNIINEDFSRDDSIFSYLWKEFTEQLIYPSQEVIVFQNSIRPEKFFTLNHILGQHKINLRWLNSLPGVLVGLGVLGTFAGLTWSLISVVPDLSEGGKNLNDAVKTLIKGSGIAFVTSIVGLFSSLIFNFFSDHRMSKIQGLVDEFNSNLEKSLKFITEEHLLTLHLKEMSQQGKYLENMDEKIALKIGDMTKQIGMEIKNVVSKSNQSMSENFFTDIANKIANSMEGFSKQQAENLNKNLSMLQDTIPSLIERLDNSQKQNEQATSGAINNLASISTDNQKQLDQRNKEFCLHLEKSQKQSEESMKAVMHNMFSAHQNTQKQAIDTMQSMKSGLESVTSNFKQGMNQTFLNSSEELKKLLDSSSQVNSNILKQTKDAQTVYQTHLDQKNKEFNLHLEKSQKQNEENMKAVMHNMFSAHQNTQKQVIGSIFSTMQGMRGDLENITSDFKQGMNQTLSSSSETLKKLLDISIQINSSILKQTKDIQITYQKHSDQFISNLNKAIIEAKDITSSVKASAEGFFQASHQQAQVAEKNEHLIDSFDSLSEQLRNMSISASDMLQKTPQLITQIEASNQFLKDLWNRYENRFQDVDESASHLFEKITEGLQLVSNQSAEHIEQLSQQSANVSNHFAQAVEQLQEAIEEMNDSKNRSPLKAS